NPAHATPLAKAGDERARQQALRHQREPPRRSRVARVEAQAAEGVATGEPEVERLVRKLRPEQVRARATFVGDHARGGGETVAREERRKPRVVAGEPGSRRPGGLRLRV